MSGFTGPINTLPNGAAPQGTDIVPTWQGGGASPFTRQITWAQLLAALGIVQGPGPVVSGNLAAFIGTTGSDLNDSGIALTHVVQGPGSSVSANLPQFSNTSGNGVSDSGLPVAGVLTKVSTVAALRSATSATLPSLTVYVAGYRSGADGGEGVFWYKSGDTTSADNGGTIIIDASSRRWYRETQGLPLSIRWFGATGDGTTNDSPAIQATITAAVAAARGIYIPAAPVYYLIQTPINLTTIGAGQPGIVISGDGCYPCSARITPTGGSTLAGATGAGGCVFDCTGSSGIIFRDLTIASIGITNASTVGVLMGNSAALVNGGSSCGFDNVSIMLPATGSSLPLYGINVNLLTMNKLNTMGDYGVYISNANDLSIAPPYGIRGANIQSDGIASFGCFLGGYGTQPPFQLTNATSHQHDQLYIVNLNGGPGFTGQPHAMQFTDCTDISIKVEIDYFPCAVRQLGVWRNVALTGIIYQWTTPMAAGQPSIASLDGTAIYGGQFAILGLAVMPAGTVAYGTASISLTMQAILGTSFVFDTAINATMGYFNFTGSNPYLMWNCRWDGNTDGPPVTLQLNSVNLTSGQYRIFVNGLRTGTA